MNASISEHWENDDILNLKSKEAVTRNLAGKFAAGIEVENCDTAGEQSAGAVLDTETASGQPIGVLPWGFKKITSGAAFGDLAKLAVGADGKYRTATAGQWVVALAMAAAAGADENVLAFLLPMAQYRLIAANIAPITDNSGGVVSDTLAVINMPADAPATADALRDDLVANALPAIKNAIASLSEKVDAILATLDTEGVTL